MRAHRRKHVFALAEVFVRIAEKATQFATPFQVWVDLSGGDAGSDATYLHTPNPNGTSFPCVPESVEWGVPLPDHSLEAAFRGLPLRVGRLSQFNEYIRPKRIWTSYIIYSPAVGVALEPAPRAGRITMQ